MDANENMTNGHMQRMLSEDDVGLRPVTMSKHPDLPLTPTHMRGNQPGRVPVDEVWATNDLPVDKAGWLAFYKCPGDHRVPMIEIDSRVLLGNDLIRIARPPARRLSCRIPRAKKCYQQRKISHFQRHKVLEKLHRVYGTSTSSLSAAQKVEMEKIDKVRVEGMKYAEKKCRKLAMGEVDFSPELGKARQRKLLWKKIVRKKRGYKVSSSYIKRKARQCGVQCPLSCTLDQAIRYRKTAIDEYEKLKPIAERLRKEHLWSQAHDHSETGNETTRKHAKRLLREEIQRETARHLRRTMGRSRNGAVDWIEVEEDGNVDEDGEAILTRYDDQQNVERILMENNSKRFRLTETTPPMQEPLVGLLGYLGNTEAARQILDGTFVCPPELELGNETVYRRAPSYQPRDHGKQDFKLREQRRLPEVLETC